MPSGLLNLFLCLLYAGLPLVAQAARGYDAPVRYPARIEQVEMLHDPAGDLHVHDVATVQDSRFQTIDLARGAGHRSGTVWLRLTVWGGDDMAGPQWLLLNSPLVRQAQLFSWTGSVFEASTTLGLRTPLDARDLPWRLPVFELTPAPGRTQTYLLRVQSDVNLWIDPHLLTPAQLLEWVKHEHTLFGLLVACHALLVISSLWFARCARDHAHVWLAGLACANLLFLLGINSLLWQDLLRDHLDWYMPLVSALWAIRVPLAAAFVLSYLQSDRNALARGYLLLLTFVAVADWLLSLGSGPQIWARWYQGWAIAQLCLLLLFAAYQAHRGTRGAVLLLFSLLPPLLGAWQSMASHQAGQALTFWPRHGLGLGFAGFLIVIQYAAFRRHHDLRLAYEQARSRALEDARTTERLLEARVAARTRELDTALAAAQSSLAVEERAHDEQRRFFLTMQHELRTPLAVIDAANRNLQHDLPADSGASRLRCERIGQAVRQLNALVSESLRHKRVDEAQTSPHPVPTELRPLLQDACDAALSLSPGHALVQRTDALPDQWLCDPALTALALRTLVINAVKYTPAGTRVVVSGHSDTDSLYLEVRDNGPGVSPEDLPHLFERYFRARNSTGVPGTGLGLPLARKMIMMQGGRLDADSVEHAGFTATIWLPRHPLQPRPGKHGRSHQRI